jgi:hypothetical protein
VKDDELKGEFGSAVRRAAGIDAESKDTPNGQYDVFIWVVFVFGAPSNAWPLGACAENSAGHYFSCNGIAGSMAFQFDNSSRRFEMAYIGGYTNQAGSDQSDDLPC